MANLDRVSPVAHSIAPIEITWPWVGIFIVTIFLTGVLTGMAIVTSTLGRVILN